MSNAMDHFKPDPDPAVRTWAESLAASADKSASTSALLRRLIDEVDQIRADYNAVLLECDEAVRRCADFEQVREELRQKTLQHEGCLDDYQQWESEKSDFVDRSLALKAENENLRAEVARLTTRHARAYQLTDKGLAATEETRG